MKWVWRLLILALLVAAGIWLYPILFPSEEKVIRKRLKELEQLLSTSSKESPIAKLGNAAKIGTYFSPDVQISFDLPGEGHFEVNGSDEIIALATRVRELPGGVQVQFLDVTVTVNPDKESGTAVLTGRAEQGGNRDFHVQELKFTLKKINGEWRIIKVEAVKTLSLLEQNPALAG